MKHTAKNLARIFALGVVLPVWCCYRVTALALGTTRAFPGWSQLFALLPGNSGVYLRRAFYGLVFPHVGEDACIAFGTIFSHPSTTLGKTAYVGAYCVIGDADIGDDVLIASQVSIVNGSRQHGIERLDIPVREQPGEWPRITIGEDTWIGDRAVIMADVGKHCVIGAGAVVTKPIPDYAIAVGNPARVIRYRNESSPTEPAPVDQSCTAARSESVEPACD